jgi:pimeloyl-ACP methyl ester carboxylesterase
MRWLLVVSSLNLLAGCSGEAGLLDSPPPSPPSGEPARGTPGTVGSRVRLHLVYVHGVSGNDGSRAHAERDLRDLDQYVEAGIAKRVTRFEQARSGVRLHVTSSRVNLYTDAAGQLLVPGLDEVTDGTGFTTASRWRAQLAEKLRQTVPPDVDNVVLIGHSTGGRVAMEVAANTSGKDQPGLGNWGWEDRIAGVVSVNGMIDDLQNPEYNFLGPLDYFTGCRVAQGAGWCEYSAYISGVKSADVVATQKRALMLVSAGDCSPSPWTGENDKALPIRAQASPLAYGLSITPVAGETYGPAHGVRYGSFCHSDITDGRSLAHADAVEAVGERILTWLFDAAPRLVSSQGFVTAALKRDVWSPELELAGACPPGERDLGLPDALGTCRHPGLVDGNDHPMNALNLLDVRGDGLCGGSAHWLHHHDGAHPGALWMKSYSVPSGGGLLSTLRAPP